MYHFETKCRRCGQIHTTEDTRFDGNHPLRYERFVAYMTMLIRDSVVFDCSSCCKKTVQDVVSYCSREEEK